MSAELPVIASDFKLWREIVVDTGAGICVDPQSPQAIAGAIRTLLENPDVVRRMGDMGRKAVLSTYNWPSEAEKLARFYQGLA
jgi:glycosyltransferase involved in cell wall biosynthesis